MAFKGIANRNGRPKNALNKNTKEIKEAFRLLVENNIDQLKKDVTALKPNERVNAILQISKYLLPTYKSIEMETNIENTNNELLQKLMAIDDSKYIKL